MSNLNSAYPCRIVFSVVLQNQRSLREMVTENYFQWVDNNLTDSHFPDARTGPYPRTVDFEYLSQAMYAGDILHELRQHQRQAAVAAELLAACCAMDRPRRGSLTVYALGQCWRDKHGNGHAAFVLAESSIWAAGLTCTAGLIPKGCHIATVRDR